MDKHSEFAAFVASLTYDTEMVPMTIEDAQYTLDQWKEEGSIEPPEGFTAEIFSEIWNRYCPEPEPEKIELKEEEVYTAQIGDTGIMIRFDLVRGYPAWDIYYRRKDTPFIYAFGLGGDIAPEAAAEIARGNISNYNNLFD